MTRIWLRKLTRARMTVESAILSTHRRNLLPSTIRTILPGLGISVPGVAFAKRSFSHTSLHRESSSRPLNTQNVTRNPSGVTGGKPDDPAPGRQPPQGDISVVFTDIVKSTNMWEKDAKAMLESMRMHDSMIRSLMEANQGYEVKQNGDGFMIAFPTATRAVQFCLDVQEQLLDEQWPKAILKLPPGQETIDSDGHVLFRGLRLRMSAHWGAPESKWNEVIQRMDYLGPMVNRAARFIQATEGGQIVVSEDFLLQLQDELTVAKGDADKPSQAQMAAESGHTTAQPSGIHAGSLDLGPLRSKGGQRQLTHQQFEIRLLGDHEFKGLEEPQKLYFIVPRSLEGRVDHWYQVTHVPGIKGNVRSK